MALVTVHNGTHDDSRIYTAWELGADWWWISAGAYSAQIVGGRTLYGEISIGGREGVRCSYITVKNGLAAAVVRYVPFDTPMRLVKVADYTDYVLDVRETPNTQPTPTN